MTRNKVSVPESISIICYDDIDFAAAAATPFTSVANPATNLAVQPHDSSLMRWQAERCTSTGRSSSSPNLVIRKSIQPPVSRNTGG